MVRLRRVGCLAISALVLSPVTRSRTAEPYVYPAKGQSQEQTSKHKYECASWAKERWRFDPMEQPAPTSPPPRERGGAARGAARGATLGEVGGAIAGDAGEGAAIGAATGGLFGHMRRRASRREREEWANRQASEYKAQRGNYEKAWPTCLRGRGYTVS